jgi:hypothetical protein
MASPSTSPPVSTVWNISRIGAIREALASSASRRQVSRASGSASGWVSSPIDGWRAAAPNTTNPSNQGTLMRFSGV